MNTSQIPGDPRPLHDADAQAGATGSVFQNILIYLAIAVAVVVTAYKLWELMNPPEKPRDPRLERLEARRTAIGEKLKTARNQNLPASEILQIELDSVIVADSIYALSNR